MKKESSVSKEDYLQVREIGMDPKSGKPVSARVEDLDHLYKLVQKMMKKNQNLLQFQNI